MEKKLLFLILFFAQNILISQEDAWVYLIDKENVQSSISNPTSILTQEAIDRKNAHGIAIDERDVPVNESYITQLKNATGITVMAKSKWFNAVHVRGTEQDINNLKTTFSFVDYIDFADKSLIKKKTTKQNKSDKLERVLTDFNYGNALNQIQMIKGDELHELNYTGTGIKIAVLDAGFPNVNSMTSFERLNNAGNVKDVYDFVDRDYDVYNSSADNHGTLVLSTMAGYIENQYVGTAPDAEYYLFITEDTGSESPVEESYWVEAAERADSLGVDIINTSLGYTTYDNPNYSYTTSQMDGNTAYITKGANIAFEKGMLLVTSAGNSGEYSWGIVGAPADASGVLSVGAVNSSGTYASFSSLGNSAQPSQKPDVVVQGQASAVINENDAISTINGTSFSSPIMAGAIACLWQALPNKTNAEIMQLVRESASQYTSPDYYLGYGIPDLLSAYNSQVLSTDNENIYHYSLYPNPVKDKVFINSTFDIKSPLTVSLFNILGKHISTSHITSQSNFIDMSSLLAGIYLVKVESKVFKIVKQ
ncbi:serine protease [Seonamhaeicola sp. S2-3]|uniref:S8 family serine peptidase n=1 Tax=Seonamhaeicola sp. S2-3 TaxID=1936081 RepID=UPI0009729D86|nr:S8 family serine peptidase [Seonamhaeicola sp. S2-3]APY09765.1 serine protease [Seonamhaeicola sp. S2-3]